MSINRRSRSALVGAAVLATFTLAGAAPAAAVPYADEPSVETMDPNPDVGGTVTLQIDGFDPNETIYIELHSTPVLLKIVQSNSSGEVSTTVQLPSDARCQHAIVVHDAASEDVASTQIFIGPPSACTPGGSGDGGNTGSGNTGSGNTGHGNTGNNNTGHGNTGDNNTGHGNTGYGNSGWGNTGDDNYGGGGNASDGNTGWGNVSHATAMPEPEGNASEIALGALAGLAIVGGTGFLCRRRAHSA